MAMTFVSHEFNEKGRISPLNKNNKKSKLIMFFFFELRKTKF